MTWKAVFLATTLAAGLLLSACGADSGKVYDQPIDKVHRALETVEKPPVFGSGRVDFVVDASKPDQIIWTVGQGGVRRVRLEAMLSADNATSTRVRVEAGLTDDRPIPGQGPALQSQETVLALYKAAMAERIDSTLMHRDFDITAIYPQLAAATAANIGTISRQMDEVGAASRKQDEDNIKKAYADEAAGRFR